jgi:LPXTG-motif cell wall-anchored protein
MAFGPSVIDISISPVLLVILVGMAGAAGGAWFVFGRRRRRD